MSNNNSVKSCSYAFSEIMSSYGISPFREKRVSGNSLSDKRFQIACAIDRNEKAPFVCESIENVTLDLAARPHPYFGYWKCNCPTRGYPDPISARNPHLTGSHVESVAHLFPRETQRDEELAIYIFEQHDKFKNAKSLFLRIHVEPVQVKSALAIPKSEDGEGRSAHGMITEKKKKPSFAVLHG